METTILDGSKGIERLGRHQKASLIFEIVITAIEKERSRGLIDSLAIERCLEAIEKLKSSFSKKRKT